MINFQRRELSSPLLGGLLIVIIFLTALGAAAPWNLRMGFIATALGILVLIASPVVRLGKPVLLLSLGFLLLGLAPFLPAPLFGIPVWRGVLENLGVETGGMVAIQWKQALEHHLSFVLIFLAGLWILGQRFSTSTSRNLALAFVLGVVFYVILAKVFADQIAEVNGRQKFGFLPNRNHTGNLLSVGFVCGLGALFQAVRQKEHFRWILLILANGLIIWTILSWNTSRAGIVLCFLGTLFWLVLLGKRYFGRHELKALGLVLLLVGGIYAISEFQVKDRVNTTVETITKEDPLHETKFSDWDFRVPIAQDTLQMISDAPLTGVGAGQFRWTFPQYRQETIVANNSVALHPESSWLWLAAELGIPSALCILALVVFLFVKGAANIKKPGHRDRALRFGCLVAAALLPLHSLFDVPAHRPSLLIASLFLFVLSQNPSEGEEGKSPRLPRWPSMTLAAFLLACGVPLLGSFWFGWNPPVVVRSEERLAEGASWYERVADLQDPLPPFEALALRQEIVSLAEGSMEEAPLDGRLYRLAGLAQLPSEFEAAETRRYFEIDRQLTPFSVSIPLLHASASMHYDLEELKDGWTAALTRAKAVDRLKGEGEGDPVTKGVLRAIASGAKKNPQFQSLAEEIRFERYGDSSKE